MDSFVRVAASGMVAAVVLRSLAGFGFPLFAPHMYVPSSALWLGEQFVSAAQHSHLGSRSISVLVLWG